MNLGTGLLGFRQKIDARGTGLYVHSRDEHEPEPIPTHLPARCSRRRFAFGRKGRTISATIRDRGEERVIEGQGSGPLDAFVDALRRAAIADIAVLAYHQHALGAGSDAQAAAYVEARLPDGKTIFGVAIDPNIVSASLRALASIAGRARSA